MNTRLTSTLRKLACAGLLLPLAVMQTACADELWDRTETLVKQREIWIPGKVETHQVVKDGKGEMKSENLVVVEIQKNHESGDPDVHLVRLMEGEKDRTEKSRKEIEAEFSKKMNSIEMDFPFHLKKPSEALTGKSEERKTIHGIECEGYLFAIEQVDEESQLPMRFEGTVWIDPESAAPLEIESHLVNTPHKVEDAEIASLFLKRCYELEDGQLIPLSEEQNLWVNAKFLFKTFVLYVESATTYRDHWYWKGALKP